MMIGIVSRLTGEAYQQVEELQRCLAAEHRVDRVGVFFPHLTYALGETPALLAQLSADLEALAAATDSFSIAVFGLGIFAGPAPVLYMPVPRSPHLAEIHEAVGRCVLAAGGMIDPKYQAESWLPHVTLLSQLPPVEALPAMIADLQARPLHLTSQLVSFCLAQEIGERWEIVREFSFRGQNTLPANPFGLSSRPCQPADRAFVCELVEETLRPIISVWFPWDRSLLEQSFESGWRLLEIILHQGQPVGHIQVDDSSPEQLYIARLFLKPAVHGRGWGKWLLQILGSRAEGRPVRLHVWENNPAVDFYQRQGYQIVQTEGHKHLMEKRV